MNPATALVAAGILTGSALSEAAKWRAILDPVGAGRVRGGATAEAKGPESTHFIITIRDGTPGATLTWYMHTGTCAAPGGVEGSGYPALQVGPGGTAQAAITLAVAPPASGSHIIQVHAANRAVVSCGELKAVGEAP